MAYSLAGKYIASASEDNTVRLWDAQTGTCEATYHVGTTSSVFFDSTGTLVYTDARILRIDDNTGQPDQGRHPLRPADPCDYGLSSDRVWIQRQSQPLLWLPLEYRPHCSAVTTTERGMNLVLGCLSGRVYLFHFSPF